MSRPIGFKHTEETRGKMSQKAKGRRFTEEHKRNIGKSSLGRKSFLGHKHSEITKEKIRLSRVGKIPPMLGRHLSSETKKKISVAHKGKSTFSGKHHSEETKIKLSKAKFMSYLNHPEYKEKLRLANLGKHHSEESRHKMSIAHSGDKSNLWRGGISYEPYSPEFNGFLKEGVRKRDDYVCQECNKTQEELKRKLYIHHIDYDKKNNRNLNLISLCLKCHARTNFNREHWKQYFKMKILIKDLFNPQNIVDFENSKFKKYTEK
jgi:hypothetical protein